MCMRERYGGELLCMPNLVVFGVGCVLSIPWAARGGAIEEYKEGLEFVL
jgi:hypothetical protein